jgi:hypothetical protein
MSPDNPYLVQVERVLPRVLALFDTNPLSPTFGMGDRYYWAWKLIDFGNGTFQGAANGLSRLLAAGLLPAGLAAERIESRIDAMFAGAERLRRRNGSLEEAFPYESSFCVTALVAYDLLSAVENLGPRLTAERRERYLGVVRPMVRFLQTADETHAFISNHLATGAAALTKWTLLTNEPGEARGKALLERIVAGQSAEGWYREYEGADPGYQSLATYYLADLHRMRPSWGLADSLRSSLRFLAHFAHPDGSFGGLYGSRNTRFLVPAGVEALAQEFPEAAALGRFARQGVAGRRFVVLETFDEPNLVPHFNAYCWAAVLAAGASLPASPAALPHEAPAFSRQRFDQAGIVVENHAGGYLVVNWRKGGVCRFAPKNGAPAVVNAGVAARTSDGRTHTTQAFDAQNRFRVEDNGDLTVEAPVTPMPTARPTPYNFIVLRLLNVTLMRVPSLNELIKKLLVRLVILGSRTQGPVNVRRIRVTGNGVDIQDAWAGPDQGYRRLDAADFSALHMASQGYWQQDDDADITARRG